MSFNRITKEYTGYIYKIFNDINNKIYIGQTIITIEHRFKCHINNALYLYDSTVIDRAIKKYGPEHFYVEEIISINKRTKKELQKKLDELEKYYIKFCNSLIPNGYNVDIGGNSGSSRAFAINQYDLKGNFIQRYDSVRDASEHTGLGMDAIRNCSKHKSKTCGGYIFIRDGDEPYQAKNKSVLVNQYSKDDIYIQTYNSIKEAAISVGLKDSSGIISCCKKHRYTSSGGYKWYYANDIEQPDKTKIVA